mgnify:CR=1 FL=1
MDEPGVEAHFKDQLNDVGRQQSAACRVINALARMLDLVVDGQVFRRPLDAPEEDPREQVDQLNYPQALAFLDLLGEGLGNHNSPDDQQLKNHPDEDEEEDGLRDEADVGRGSLDLATLVRARVGVAQVDDAEDEGAEEEGDQDTRLEVQALLLLAIGDGKGD